MSNLLPNLKRTLVQIEKLPVAEHRKQVLQPLINYIQSKNQENTPANLNFICTHNSRRSQFAQVWTAVTAYYFNLPVRCFSGGTEVTACNPRTISSLERSGFDITKGEGKNPHYILSFAPEAPTLDLYSKVYDDPANPTKQFAAIMTCDHADANCPLIPGAEARIPLNYIDPKEFDDTPQEIMAYEERSSQIGSEMLYVMHMVSLSLRRNSE